jgi:hypothetical protein
MDDPDIEQVECLACGADVFDLRVIDHRYEP